MKEKFTSILDAILGFNEILRSINTLKERDLLGEYYQRHSLKAKFVEEKTIMNFDAQALLKKVYTYKTKLENYLNYSDLYDNDNTIQEKNLKLTTNNFFTDVVKPVRSTALRSLKQLKQMIKHTKNKHDKELLNEAANQIVQEVNSLIEDCIHILEYEKLIIKDLKNKGIDFRFKYDLISINWEEV